MIRQCVICDSRAVLPQEVARDIALLAGLADGALRGVQDAGSPRIQLATEWAGRHRTDLPIGAAIG